MAISRYGVRLPPDADTIIEECERKSQLVQGPHIQQFERAFEQRLGSGTAIATSYGRMAFYQMLKAFDLPEGSEIILPALTFWVIPELARVAGLRVVFADIDPNTFTLDPAAFERAITPNTRAVVPTHLYGLPCDMDPIMEIARRRKLLVVEDCAHALGATYRGRQVGTFGDGALFSFQTLKPLNAYGGGMALVKDPAMAERLRVRVDALPWPDEQRVKNRIKLGRAQRFFSRPLVFTLTGFPILWAFSWFDASPEVYLWEKIRSLHPLPDSYTERFPNLQGAIGLAGLQHLDEWTKASQAHARAIDEALKDLPNVQTPVVPEGRTHVYYQYCAYVNGQPRDRIVGRCVRRGIDIETLHVDVCTEMELFQDLHSAPTPGATRAKEVIQVPVYASLTDRQLRRVMKGVRKAARS